MDTHPYLNPISCDLNWWARAAKFGVEPHTLLPHYQYKPWFTCPWCKVACLGSCVPGESLPFLVFGPQDPNNAGTAGMGGSSSMLEAPSACGALLGKYPAEKVTHKVWTTNQRKQFMYDAALTKSRTLGSWIIVSFYVLGEWG